MATQDARALSDVLDDLPEGRAVPLGEVMGPMGARAHAFALLLLGLPDAVPLPIPSVSLLVGVPLLAISAHLMLFGEGASLPGRLRAVTMPAGLAAALRRRVAPLLRRAERLSRPRWTLVAGRARLLGLLCLWLSAILLLPLPFFNTPPALCLVLLARGHGAAGRGLRLGRASRHRRRHGGPRVGGRRGLGPARGLGGTDVTGRAATTQARQGRPHIEHSIAVRPSDPA